MKNTETGFTRVFEILTYQRSKFPQQKALNIFINGSWRSYSIDEIQSRADAISAWFIKSGFNSCDKIAIVPDLGRPEWMILDFACQQAGLVVVPLHVSASLDEITLILNETGARLCITANEGLYYKILPLCEKLEGLVVQHIEPQKKGYFEPLKLIKPDPGQLEALKEAKSRINEEDLFTIMYTSGTSGIPKGVMLTHANMVSNLQNTIAVFPLDHSKRVLSFLPFSHIFERSVCYAYIACGVEVYFSHDRERIAYDFKSVRPYFCTAVPRILEKMYAFLQEEQMGKNWFKRQLVTRAMKVARAYRGGHKLRQKLAFDLFLARIMVLYPWRRLLGGKLQCIVVGAAALQPEIGRFFSAAKIRIREGYGMTETSPIISINRFEPGLNRFGTVGIPMPGVTVKIDTTAGTDEGEILVKGHNVMKGYYRKPGLTQQILTPDGWLRTGDIGKFVEGKFLQITDRKKDIFKTSAGKYIAPLPLTNLFTSSPFIEQCLIIGFKRPYVTALLVPQFSILKKWCEANAIHWTAPQYMVHNIKVRNIINREVVRLNEELPNYERVKNFVLCHEEWTSEKGEITATLKPVRQALLENYRKEIEKMYK